MAGRCLVCAHPDRNDIDARWSLVYRNGPWRSALEQAGRASNGTRCGTSGLHPGGGRAPRRATDRWPRGSSGGLAADAAAVRAAAMATGDGTLTLRAVDTERGVLNDLARFVGLDPDAVRADLAEAPAVMDVLVVLARRDPAVAVDLAVELDQLGADDLARAVRGITGQTPAAIPFASRRALVGLLHQLRQRGIDRPSRIWLSSWTRPRASCGSTGARWRYGRRTQDRTGSAVRWLPRPVHAGRSGLPRQ